LPAPPTAIAAGRPREAVQGIHQRKNATLIRSDISRSVRQLYDATNDEAVKSKALELIGIEEDLKYRSKYSSV
jgi:hypothetical protein